MSRAVHSEPQAFRAQSEKEISVADENEARWSKTLASSARAVLIATVANVLAGVILKLLP